MKTCTRIVLVCAALAVGTLAWNAFTKFQPSDHNISFSQFLNDVDSRQVSAISISGDEVVGVNHRTGRFRTYAPRGYDAFVDRAIRRDVDVSVVPERVWAGDCTPLVLMFVLAQMGVLVFARRSVLSPG